MAAADGALSTVVRDDIVLARVSGRTTTRGGGVNANAVAAVICPFWRPSCVGNDPPPPAPLPGGGGARTAVAALHCCRHRRPLLIGMIYLVRDGDFIVGFT
jgi:hypothetical protein